jgi:lysozyme family protein
MQVLVSELPSSYLKQVLNYEGGYVNNPNDRGGETNRGITIGTLNAAKRQGLVPASVTIRSLTEDLESVRKIYNQNYYQKSKANLMPHPLAFTHFDASVHSGVGGAVKLLQRTLNKLGQKLSVDGGFGPLTASALESALEKNGVIAITNEYNARREVLYRSIVSRNPSQKEFLKGWLNRLEAVKKFCSAA